MRDFAATIMIHDGMTIQVSFDRGQISVDPDTGWVAVKPATVCQWFDGLAPERDLCEVHSLGAYLDADDDYSDWCREVEAARLLSAIATRGESSDVGEYHGWADIIGESRITRIATDITDMLREAARELLPGDVGEYDRRQAVGSDDA